MAQTMTAPTTVPRPVTVRRLCDIRAGAEQRRDQFLKLANDSAMSGDERRALVLRECAMKCLPREWASL